MPEEVGREFRVSAGAGVAGGFALGGKWLGGYFYTYKRAAGGKEGVWLTNSLTH